MNSSNYRGRGRNRGNDGRCAVHFSRADAVDGSGYTNVIPIPVENGATLDRHVASLLAMTIP